MILPDRSVDAREHDGTMGGWWHQVTASLPLGRVVPVVLVLLAPGPNSPLFWRVFQFDGEHHELTCVVFARHPDTSIGQWYRLRHRVADLQLLLVL